MSQSQRSETLFNEARDALGAIGFTDIPTFASWSDQHWYGTFDEVHGLRQAVAAIVPKLHLDSGVDRDFYVSFQPLRVAKGLEAASGGEVKIANVSLDAHEMVWEYTVNGTAGRLEGGGNAGHRFVESLNTALVHQGSPWRFSYAQTKDDGHFIVACPASSIDKLNALLSKASRKKPRTLPKGRHFYLGPDGLDLPHNEIDWYEQVIPALVALLPRPPKLKVERISPDHLTIQFGKHTHDFSWTDDDGYGREADIVEILNRYQNTTRRLVYLRDPNNSERRAFAALTNAQQRTFESWIVPLGEP